MQYDPDAGAGMISRPIDDGPQGVRVIAFCPGRPRRARSGYNGDPAPSDTRHTRGLSFINAFTNVCRADNG